MELRKTNGADEIDYNQEIAKRLAYAYFSAIGNDGLGFMQWSKLQQQDWDTRKVLRQINSKAKEVLGEGKTPLLLLIIDEPDHEQGVGALRAIQVLGENALNMDFDVECRVIFSPLEQLSLIWSSSPSGRRIQKIKLSPPESSKGESLLFESFENETEKKDVNATDLKEAGNMPPLSDKGIDSN